MINGVDLGDIGASSEAKRLRLSHRKGKGNEADNMTGELD